MELDVRTIQKEEVPAWTEALRVGFLGHAGEGEADLVAEFADLDRTIASFDGDRVVGTRLDHDANVSPWRIACERSGAEHVLAPFDPVSGRLAPATVVDLIDERTRWVAVTGASRSLTRAQVRQARCRQTPRAAARHLVNGPSPPSAPVRAVRAGARPR